MTSLCHSLNCEARQSCYLLNGIKYAPCNWVLAPLWWWISTCMCIYTYMYILDFAYACVYGHYYCSVSYNVLLMYVIAQCNYCRTLAMNLILMSLPLSLSYSQMEKKMNNSWISWIHIAKQQNSLGNISEKLSSFSIHMSTVTKIHYALTCTNTHSYLHNTSCHPQNAPQKIHVAYSYRYTKTSLKSLT